MHLSRNRIERNIIQESRKKFEWNSLRNLWKLLLCERESRLGSRRRKRCRRRRRETSRGWIEWNTRWIRWSGKEKKKESRKREEERIVRNKLWPTTNQRFPSWLSVYLRFFFCFVVLVFSQCSCLELARLLGWGWGRQVGKRTNSDIMTKRNKMNRMRNRTQRAGSLNASQQIELRVWKRWKTCIGKRNRGRKRKNMLNSDNHRKK